MPAKKTKKVDSAIVVAVIGLVGTIIAALLASPIIPKLFDREPTAASNDSQARSVQLIFSNDFESGSSSGFSISSDGYEVVKEKNNQVLQMSGSGSGSLYAFFGPTDFSDGVIVFRLNYRYFDSFLLNFRAELDLHTYTLYFSQSRILVGRCVVSQLRFPLL